MGQQGIARTVGIQNQGQGANVGASEVGAEQTEKCPDSQNNSVSTQIYLVQREMYSEAILV